MMFASMNTITPLWQLTATKSFSQVFPNGGWFLLVVICLSPRLTFAIHAPSCSWLGWFANQSALQMLRRWFQCIKAKACHSCLEWVEPRFVELPPRWTTPWWISCASEQSRLFIFRNQLLYSRRFAVKNNQVRNPAGIFWCGARMCSYKLFRCILKVKLWIHWVNEAFAQEWMVPNETHVESTQIWKLPGNSKNRTFLDRSKM